MDSYISNFYCYNKKIIYNFEIGNGGIGDCLKFFMYILNICINNNIRLYYKINNLGIEKYIKLKFNKMYINDEEIDNKKYINNECDIFKIENENEYNIVIPFIFYENFRFDDIKMNIEEVFEFSSEVKFNKNKLLSENIISYESLHLRLGDKYLETDKSFVNCPHDERQFDEQKIFDYIEKNNNKNIIFFCDNQSYKLKLKQKYPNLILLNSEVGHTGLLNTTDKQVLDSVTEFYIMSNSEKIISASYSGFSLAASKFKNVPIITI